MMMSLSTQETKFLKIKENLNPNKKYQDPGQKAPKKTKKKKAKAINRRERV
jgi:hypothetical protein